MQFKERDCSYALLTFLTMFILLVYKSPEINSSKEAVTGILHTLLLEKSGF